MTMEPNEEFSGKERKVRKEEVGATGWSPGRITVRGCTLHGLSTVEFFHELAAVISNRA
jgi:hypothetical protein